jgi:excisionase family DNA binding protein
MKYLNVQEVADRLGVAPTTIYALCQKKVIPHVRVGTGRGAIRISEDGLARYLAGAAVQQDDVGQPPPPPPIKLKHLKV